MEAEAYQGIFEIEEKLWWYRGRRKVCFGLLDRYLPKDQSLKVLDVGCGTGYNVAELARYGTSQGVDMSAEALEFCRRRGVNNVALHEADELPFPDQEFDLVTAFDVIEHIDDDRAALEEFRRVLKPRGYLLIYTPALPWMYNEHDRIVHHKRRYMGAELTEKLEGAGYQILHQSYTNLLMLPIVLLARLVFSLLPKKSHREMEMTPEPFNSIFTQLCYLEYALVASTGLPIGMSLVSVARSVD